jgi:protein-S-isoprenylcysteine O-methyltransferase Ste14
VSWLDVLVVLGYASLVVELVLLPVPSEASTWQLFRPQTASSDELRRAQSLPAALKLIAYLAPTALGVALFLLPLAVALVPALRAELPWSLEPAGWLAAAGLWLTASGRALTIKTALGLRRQRRRGGLRQHGLFSWSRNPGLVGMYAFYLGNCALCPSLVLLLGLPLYMWNMHRRVRLEESHLQGAHGPVYSDYRQRVPRYL